jgi:hypothetical protein
MCLHQYEETHNDACDDVKAKGHNFGKEEPCEAKKVKSQGVGVCGHDVFSVLVCVTPLFYTPITSLSTPNIDAIKRLTWAYQSCYN